MYIKKKIHALYHDPRTFVHPCQSTIIYKEKKVVQIIRFQCQNTSDYLLLPPRSSGKRKPFIWRVKISNLNKIIILHGWSIKHMKSMVAFLIGEVGQLGGNFVSLTSLKTGHVCCGPSLSNSWSLMGPGSGRGRRGAAVVTAGGGRRWRTRER